MKKLAFVGTVMFLSISAFAGGTGTCGGRYQIIQLGTARADQYLLDTLTGALWHGVCLPGSNTLSCNSVWQRQMIEGLNLSEKEFQTLLNGPETPRTPASH